jgi:hypothetical protein
MSRPEPAEEANRIPPAHSPDFQIRRAGIWASDQIYKRTPGANAEAPSPEVRLDVLLLREIGVVTDPLALSRDAHYGSRTAGVRRKGTAP